MRIFDYFRNQDKSSAAIAKERLQVIVAHERTMRNQPDYLPRLQQEILTVIRKYVSVEQEDVNVHIDQNDDCSVLELNIVLPEDQTTS